MSKFLGILGILFSFLLFFRSTLISKYILFPWTLVITLVLTLAVLFQLILAKRFNFILLILVLIGPISSVFFNNIPAYFKAEQRLALFILNILAFGVFFISDASKNFRINTCKFLILNMCVLGSIASGLWYVLGIPNIGKGYFSGIFTHSMLLAPFAGISVIYCFWRMTGFKCNKLYLLFFLLSVIALLAANSRIALLSTLIGILYLIIKKVRTVHKITILLLILPLALIVSEYSIVSPILHSALTKGTLNTREILWKNRLIEFRSSPIVGIGFASVNPTYKLSIGQDKSEFDKETGVVEPGSSFLAIISMTGLIGVVGFLTFIFFCFRDKKRCEESYLLNAILVFYAIHMWAEGYIYAAGSIQGTLFWLVISNRYYLSKTNLRQPYFS